MYYTVYKITTLCFINIYYDNDVYSIEAYRMHDGKKAIQYEFIGPSLQKIINKYVAEITF